MMEESSDESAEIVDKDEAVNAEQQFVAQQSGSVSSPGSTSALAPPAPLPSFMSPTTPISGQATPTSPVVTPTPSTQTTPTAVKVPSTPQVTPPTPVQPISPQPVVPSPQQMLPPGPQQTPFEANTAISITPDMESQMTMTPGSPQSPGGGGLFSWLPAGKMLNRMVEKTKSSMETVITTLDPGMKEVIRSGGEIQIIVTSTKETKVGAIREAFQNTFGRATVIGKESQAKTAAQPVGFTAGLKGAQERLHNLRQSDNIPEDQPVVSVEGFIVEMLPDRWYEMSCLVLQDPEHRIDLQTFSQPSPIPAEYILKAQDRTPKDYPLRWSGLAVTIGEIVEEATPHIGHVDWQNGIVGISRRESLFLAAKSLAYMYKQRLPTAFVS